jgi:hypothetical protein
MPDCRHRYRLGVDWVGLPGSRPEQHAPAPAINLVDIRTTWYPTVSRSASKGRVGCRQSSKVKVTSRIEPTRYYSANAGLQRLHPRSHPRSGRGTEIVVHVETTATLTRPSAGTGCG